MSKVVKKVGKAIGKVVKGVVKGVKKVWKKIGQKKFLKIAAIAAAIYFGGAALMGGIGGVGAGGFMAGAKAGVASAWGGITSAGTALASGNIAGAGSSLYGGFTGAYGAGAGTAAAGLAPITAATPAYVAPGAGGATTGAASTGAIASNIPPSVASGMSAPGAAAAGSTNYLTAAQQSAAQLAKVGVTPQMVANAGTTTASQGLLGSIGSAAAKGWNSLGTYGKFAAVQGGIGLGSGYLQGKAEEDAAAEALAQYQANMGGVIYAPVYNPATGLYEVPYQGGGRG